MRSGGQPFRRGLLHSFRCAFRGVWLCLCSERNMRIHALACGYVLFFAVKMGIAWGELALLLLAVGMVTAAEALNTAIEKLCDFVQPQQDRRIGVVKDMAAGGVALSAAFAALTGAAVLLRPELWEVLRQIAGTPWKLTLFAVSLGASLWVVFGLPLVRPGDRRE